MATHQMDMSDDDDGFLELKLPDGQTCTLDIFVAAEKFSAAVLAGDNDSAQQAETLAAAMAAFGIPPMSYRAHHRIARRVCQLWDAAQKKDGATRPLDDAAGSPDSTDSTPGSTPTGSPSAPPS